MVIGALLTWDDRAYHSVVVSGGRAPIGWEAYGVAGGFGGGCGSARRMPR